MTLVIGNGKQQAWPPNNSGPLNNTGLSLNSQPALWSLNGLPGESCPLWTVICSQVQGYCSPLSGRSPARRFTTKFQHLAGNSVLGFNKHSCRSRLLLLRTLLERHLKATRIGEGGKHKNWQWELNPGW